MFPTYLSYGMSYEQYWEGDPLLTTAYRKANYIDIERRNYDAWIQGLYFYNALGAIMSNVFAKRGAKKEKYIDKPFTVLPKTEVEIAREAEREREKAIAMFTAWGKSWTAKHPQGGG